MKIMYFERVCKERVCKDFERKYLGEYHDLFVPSDTLLGLC